MMRGRHRAGRRATIDTLLSDAEVLAGDYGDADVAAVRKRLLDEPADVDEPADTDGSAPARPPGFAPEGEELPPAGPASSCSVPASAPVAAGAAGPDGAVRHYPTECEQAAHDLDLAVSLVVNAPEAAASLMRLVDDDEAIAPGGALVFGCLLHLARYREAAQFWWQFAAGAGCRTAAFCLCLHHRRHSEFRDAEYWRAQSAKLGRRAGLSPRRRPQTGRPLLPERVRHGLLSACRGGGHPSLPHALEAVIHRLPVAVDDEDFGEIPQPAPDLPGHLTAS